MTKSVTFSTVLRKEGRLQVAWSPELDIASQGKTVKEALNKLRETIELYLEDKDAKIPTNRSTIITTISVKTRVQTGNLG